MAGGRIARWALLLGLALAAPAAAAPPVVAVLGDDGFNPLHQEFRATPGKPVVYPASMPAPVFVDLPKGATFAEQFAQLRSGPLANLKPGVLYAIRGTRVLVINPGERPDAIPDSDGSIGLPLPPRTHGTGVLDSAIGAKVGTAPDAVGLFVSAGPDSLAAWDWLVSQKWIDAVSMSVYPVNYGLNGGGPGCQSAATVRRTVAGGTPVFSSGGNTADAGEQQVSPNGLAEVYQVGAVTEDGRTYLPGSVIDPNDPQWTYETSTHPYQTGALAFYQAAGPDSFDGWRNFGATSGATPRTAGYALRLIASAREILRGGRKGVALASLGPGGAAPPRGPLADGDLTVAELEDVLRHTAAPYEMPTPLRYMIEGYGAVTDATVALAEKVLSGEAAAPLRADEDRMHDAVTQARQADLGTRCAG
jgi:hypothetical protein